MAQRHQPRQGGMLAAGALACVQPVLQALLCRTVCVALKGDWGGLSHACRVGTQDLHLHLTDPAPCCCLPRVVGARCAGDSIHANCIARAGAACPCRIKTCTDARDAAHRSRWSPPPCAAPCAPARHSVDHSVEHSARFSEEQSVEHSAGHSHHAIMVQMEAQLLQVGWVQRRAGRG